ncbi:unnamed protein product [Trypanosoma congolense IL3000]|uniref:WGS project CAEQ00000000 data, annotated contig 2193 n=1 Tax=Trypanosoma congolense (strain IL3000) TaxID=1068625 RepID=F9WC74_TRYCI|nr:unnamed protein product [Trypanosoma congolense IL3000]
MYGTLKNQENDLNRVARLDTALEAVRNGVRLYRPNGEFLHILGEINDIRGCSGRNANEIYTAYHQRVGRRGIPGEQRLRHLLQELYTRFEKPMEYRTQETMSWSSPAAPQPLGHPCHYYPKCLWMMRGAQLWSKTKTSLTTWRTRRTRAGR